MLLTQTKNCLIYKNLVILHTMCPIESKWLVQINFDIFEFFFQLTVSISMLFSE